MSISITSNGVHISRWLEDKVHSELKSRLIPVLDDGFFCHVFFKNKNKDFEKQEKNRSAFKLIGVQIIIKDAKKEGTFIKVNKVGSSPYIALKRAVHNCVFLAKKFNKKSNENHYANVKENDMFEFDVDEKIRLEKNDIVSGNYDLVIMNDQHEFDIIGLDDAVEKFELLSMDLLMFINIDNNKCNLIYRRADRSIGWIDMDEKINIMRGAEKK